MQPCIKIPAFEFVVLLLPGFSQLCFASLIEPLRLANSLTAMAMFGWRIVSLDGRPVECASGIPVWVSGSLFDVEKTLGPQAALVLCAGEGVEKHSCPLLRGMLRRCLRANVQIYALGTATVSVF